MWHADIEIDWGEESLFNKFSLQSSKVEPRSLQTGINADNEYFFEIITVESEPRLFERSVGNCLLY